VCWLLPISSEPKEFRDARGRDRLRRQVPVGRAGKGSLVSIRPDDLAAQMVRAALDKVPSLDPTQIDDLINGLRTARRVSRATNIGRVVSVLLGMDHLPGCTVTRYCASSCSRPGWPSTPSRPGEGDVFISAGVETVSRFVKGSSDGLPDTKNPLFRRRPRPRTVSTAEHGADEWHDPREDDAVPDV